MSRPCPPRPGTLRFTPALLTAALLSSAAATSFAGQVIYQVMPDRFFNGDKTNDGVSDPSNLRAWHGGDLAGLSSKLGYLKKLGVSAVWLTPIYQQQPGRSFETDGYHGYWPADFRSVDSHFGTQAEWEALRQGGARGRAEGGPRSGDQPLRLHGPHRGSASRVVSHPGRLRRGDEQGRGVCARGVAGFEAGATRRARLSVRQRRRLAHPGRGRIPLRRHQACAERLPGGAAGARPGRGHLDPRGVLRRGRPDGRPISAARL